MRHHPGNLQVRLSQRWWRWRQRIAFHVERRTRGRKLAVDAPLSNMHTVIEHLPCGRLDDYRVQPWRTSFQNSRGAQQFLFRSWSIDLCQTVLTRRIVLGLATSGTKGKIPAVHKIPISETGVLRLRFTAEVVWQMCSSLRSRDVRHPNSVPSRDCQRFKTDVRTVQPGQGPSGGPGMGKSGALWAERRLVEYTSEVPSRRNVQSFLVCRSVWLVLLDWWVNSQCVLIHTCTYRSNMNVS